jgi:dTDP-4-dehydrorhamnose 3,5-epimerase
MNLQPTKVNNVWLIQPQRHTDERGFFARIYCRQTFEAHGLNGAIDQCSISFNARRGTLRGMHYQAPPHAEAKLVRVTRGAIFDVAIDLRPDSATFGDWVAAELTDDNRHALYIGEGCAHGFITLTDETEVAYQISAPYCREAGRGVRWNDPAFGIDWPVQPTVISERDATYADFQGAEH